MKKVILLAVFAMLPILVLAQQQYGEFLDAAKKQLSEGRVESAEKSYNVWKEMTKERDLNFETELKKEKNKIQYAPLLLKANQYYSEGKYVEAKDSLSEYTKQTGLSDINLLTKITECITWSNEARLSFERKDYSSAKSYYERILKLNPTDATSVRVLANVESEIRNKKDSNKKFVLTPEKNRFNMRVQSGFDKKTIIGLYLGGNYKMFHVGADIAIGSNYDIDGWQWGPSRYFDHDVEYAKLQDNTFSLNPNCYYSPKLQFSISPGLNLKYFSIECGLGAIMGNEYNYQEKRSEGYVYSKLKKTSKTYLLIRPTITGYIPISKIHRGFSFSVGYNIVCGASPINGVVFGVGFFI